MENKRQVFRVNAGDDDLADFTIHIPVENLPDAPNFENRYPVHVQKLEDQFADRRVYKYCPGAYQNRGYYVPQKKVVRGIHVFIIELKQHNPRGMDTTLDTVEIEVDVRRAGEIEHTAIVTTRRNVSESRVEGMQSFRDGLSTLPKRALTLIQGDSESVFEFSRIAQIERGSGPSYFVTLLDGTTHECGIQEGYLRGRTSFGSWGINTYDLIRIVFEHPPT